MKNTVWNWKKWR